MTRPVDDRKMWEAFKNSREEQALDELLESYENGEVTKKQLIEEGLWDRLKARGASAKQSGVKGTLKAMGQKALGKTLSKVGAPKAGEELQAAGVAKGYDAKTMSLLNSHVLKLEKAMADFNNDVEKLGLMTPEGQNQHPEVAYALNALTTQLKSLKTSLSPKGAVGKLGAAAGDYAGGSKIDKRSALNLRKYTPKWTGGGELRQNRGSTGTPPPPETP